MRPRSIAVSAATLIAAASMTPVAASASAADTLYVNSSSTSCSESGTGTIDAPFCSITAAAAAAQPGDTVDIATGTTYPATTITASGTAAAPIVFTGHLVVSSSTFTGGATVDGLDLSGASDVVIQNLRVQAGTGDNLAVDGGADVKFDHDAISASATAGADALHITGSASAVSVLDSTVGGETVVDGSATGTILSTNVLSSTNSTVVSLVGATTTALTGNNITGCGPEVSVTDASAGTRIENNIVKSRAGQCPAPVQTYGLLVDAGSASGTMADYNDVYAAGRAAYDWSGTPYTTGALLYGDTGQGQHDNNSLTGTLVSGATPAIDSADSAAVGEQAVDLAGDPRVRNPLAKQTGAGPYDYYDRGALEYQDPMIAVTKSFTDSPSGTKVPVGTPLTFSAAFTDTWSDSFTYTFVMGSTTLAAGTNGTYATSFSTPGTYTISVYATPTNGSATTTAFATLAIGVVPVAPLTAAESVAPDRGTARSVTASDLGTTDDWSITKVTFDFGDKTPVVPATDGEQVPHVYAVSGTYPVTETVTDADGNTNSITQSVTTNAPAVGTLTDTNIAPDGIAAYLGGTYNVPGGTGFTHVAVTGMRNGTAQAVAVTKTGTLEFATRSEDSVGYFGITGTWSAWTTLSQPGVTVTDASLAGMPDGSTQVIEVTSTGVLKHDIRNANGTWQTGGWGVPAGSTGIKQAAITAMPNGNTQLVAVTTSGVLLHNIRFAKPASWQGWRAISQPGVVVTDASIAGAPDGSAQLVEVTSTGVLKHDIRLANNTWQTGGWGVPVGSTGITQASITVLPNGVSETVAVTSGGTIETDRRNTSPKWSGWMATDLEQINGSETYATVGALPDNDAQLLVVNGG